MITEAMLSAAASRSSEIYVYQLINSFNTDEQHVFSLSFEKKIRKLKRKADHPFVYRAVRRVAVILLVLSLCSGVWLAIDVEARAAVFGWIKEMYETYFVYRFEDASNTESDPSGFRLSWLPEGYTEVTVNNTADTTMVIYANDAGEMLKFSYAHGPTQTDWFVDTTDTVKTNATINGDQAELLLSTNPTVASAILWTSSDNTAFFISGFLSEGDLIRVAENIQKI